MRKSVLSVLAVLLAASPFVHPAGSLKADEPELTALQVLTEADAVVNAPADQEVTLEMILIDDAGNETKRGARMWQKGSDRRIIKFTSPAEQKGIGFLDLPGSVMYLYMPAFKKVRRIASHVTNTSFAGTDFTYDDMAAINYADEYSPTLLESDTADAKPAGPLAEPYVLELVPREDITSDYSKLVMSVRRDNFYPVRIEHYSKDGELWKVMKRTEIKSIDGYWVAREVEMSDLKKAHKTRMVLGEIKFDQGLSDDLFTQRYLKRSAD